MRSVDRNVVMRPVFNIRKYKARYDVTYLFTWQNGDVGVIAVLTDGVDRQKTSTHDWTTRANILANCLL
jgi:hypothetical protein